MESPNFQPLPASLQDRLAIDVEQRVVYADERLLANPKLLTWKYHNQKSGLEFSIVPCEMNEIARMRESGFREPLLESQEQQELRTRAYAHSLLERAANYHASDLHLMMRGRYSEVQVMVHGELHTLDYLGQEEGQAIARAIYQGIAGTRDESYKPLEFQSAQIPGAVLGIEYVSSIRIVRGPCYPQAAGGEFMTMRMQYDVRHLAKSDLPSLPSPRFAESHLHLSEMGFAPSQIEKIERLMDCPNGLVVFTGPTGSGKTTTLFEVLQESARRKPYRRLVTVEDPVEYPMPWAVQMEVPGARNQKETGELYGERLRVALRMAPHIILLGELRGPEVSVTAIEAAITGHQVWTTLHATDPFLVVDRLELMDPQRLHRKIFCHPRILRGIVSQRLLPRLCPHCSIADPRSTEQQRLMAALSTWGDPSQVRFRGPGCVHCKGSGVSGRKAVAEVVICDEVLMNDFLECGAELARQHYRQRLDADDSLLERAIALVLGGEVDPIAVEDQVDWIGPRSVQERRPR